MRPGHRLLRMKQEEPDLDAVIRQRIRALRVARGWSLDTLAARCFLSPSTLSRIETGHRRIALDQLVPIARALETTLDLLVETEDEDVVIRPQRNEMRGRTVWTLAKERAPHNMTVAKMLIEERLAPRDSEESASQGGVHPGRDWFMVLSGTLHLRLGERDILVEAGSAAEFSCMTPHAVGAHNGPVEILSIFTQEGERAHLDD